MAIAKAMKQIKDIFVPNAIANAVGDRNKQAIPNASIGYSSSLTTVYDFVSTPLLMMNIFSSE